MSNIKTKNVCFIANYGKTEFFEKISNKLQESDVNVYWISVNRDISEKLNKSGFANRVLELSFDIDSGPDDSAEESIGFSFNDLVFSDRALKLKGEKASCYLSHVAFKVKEFIKKNEISFVFGEMTWAHEVLIYKICNQNNNDLNCKFLNPHTIRIPNGRFAFFEDEFQSKMFEHSSNGHLIEEVVKLEKPNYLRLNDDIIKRNSGFKKLISKIGLWITAKNKTPGDPTIIFDRKIVLRQRLSFFLNKYYYNRIRKSKLSDFNDKKFILFPLHKQPEASIDIIGKFYEDQYNNIKSVWRKLPNDWFILVKEHTNAIGDRGAKFYQRIQQLERVYILDEKTDSHKAIVSSAAVVTVSGTPAYEAALLDTPSLTFAPTFFNKFSLCERINTDKIRCCSDIKELIPIFNEADDKLANEYIYKNSFSGVISDSISDPSCVSESNITTVSNAFLKVIANE